MNIRSKPDIHVSNLMF